MSPLNVLFLLQPGTNSRDILIGMIEGFRLAGHETMVLGLEQLWNPIRERPREEGAIRSAFAAQLRDAIRTRKIDLVVAMWANGVTSLPAVQVDGRARSFFDEIGCPHLLYWLDAPHWAHNGQVPAWASTGLFEGDRLHHVVNNEGTAEEMRRILRFKHVSAVPNGVSTTQFAPPEPRPEIEFDLVFVLGAGEQPPSPKMLAEIENEEPDIEGIRQEIAARMRQKLHNHDGGLVEALLQSQLDQREVPMMTRIDAIRSRHPELAAPIDALLANTRMFIDVTATIRRIDNWYRAFVFCWLDRRFKCLRVGGGELPGWPVRGESVGYETDAHRQSFHYARGLAGLSVMRWQDDVGVHLKPLEISASGVPCLCMRRPGIEAMFSDGEEILVFESLPRAAELLKRLKSESGWRERIGAAALERVRREHTWSERSQVILRRTALRAVRSAK